jgi:hypothetical protein
MPKACDRLALLTKVRANLKYFKSAGKPHKLQSFTGIPILIAKLSDICNALNSMGHNIKSIGDPFCIHICLPCSMHLQMLKFINE